MTILFNFCIIYSNIIKVGCVAAASFHSSKTVKQKIQTDAVGIYLSYERRTHMFTSFANSSNVNLSGLYTGNLGLTQANTAAASALLRRTVSVQHVWQYSIIGSHKYGIIPGFKRIDRFMGIMLFSHFIRAIKKAFMNFLAGRRLELWRMVEYF